MHIVSLGKTERTHLLDLLSRSSSGMSAAIAAKLRSSDDVFGVVSWSNDDIISLLEEHEIIPSAANVNRVRNSYFARHIDDLMVECGWGVLEEAVSEITR